MGLAAPLVSVLAVVVDAVSGCRASAKRCLRDIRSDIPLRNASFASSTAIRAIRPR